MDQPARDGSPCTFVTEATASTKYRGERGVWSNVTARDNGH